MGRFDKVAHFVKSLNGSWGAQCGFFYGEQFALPAVDDRRDDLFNLVHGGKDIVAPDLLPGRDHLPMG